MDSPRSQGADVAGDVDLFSPCRERDESLSRRMGVLLYLVLECHRLYRHGLRDAYRRKPLVGQTNAVGGSVVRRRPPNKGMKQTKPAQAMERRSSSPVFCGL